MKLEQTLKALSLDELLDLFSLSSLLLLELKLQNKDAIAIRYSQAKTEHIKKAIVLKRAEQISLK